jgi:hypothetical protein
LQKKTDAPLAPCAQKITANRLEVHAEEAQKLEKDLHVKEVSLLYKWWWMLECEEGLWKDIARLKYVKTSPTCVIRHSLNESPICQDLIQVKGKISCALNGLGASVLPH